MLTLLIRGARLVDGSGRPSTTGDLAVSADRIVAVGGRIAEPAGHVIDADGRVVCPGFIDLHNHADFVVDKYPRIDGMARQGVTTIVTGNCGMSPFPVADGATGWANLAEFATAGDSMPLAINIAPLIGHGAIRSAAMPDPSMPASDDEIEHMVALADEALRQGALGISTGLIYDPGRFADTRELIALAKVARQHNGFYASHIRGEADTLVDAVGEAIAIGRAAGVAVQLSHHKAKRRRNWGRVATTLRMVDEAVADGLDVMLDCYPYTASSTSLWAYLPHWARAHDLLATGDGLPEQLRRRLVDEMEDIYPGCSAGNGAVTDLSDLTISHVAEAGLYSRFEGMHLDDAARYAGVSQADFVLDILMAGRKVQIIDHAMSEADVQTVLAHPRCMVGSDARRIHHEIPGVPHPRNFGTFTRFVADFVPERMSLETAIHKCTGLPAERLGWSGRRGGLTPGAAADLLMFDPSRLHDHATFADPKRYSTGLDLVVVNGEVVVEDDADTQAPAGRMLLATTEGGV